MTAKQRIKQLEKTSGAGKSLKVIAWEDAREDGRPAKFDGVEMPQAEAERKAAEYEKRDDVLVIHICFASEAIKDGVQ